MPRNKASTCVLAFVFFETDDDSVGFGLEKVSVFVAEERWLGFGHWHGAWVQMNMGRSTKKYISCMCI